MNDSDLGKPLTAPAPKPWVKVVLVLSLALNLAVAGIVAGAFLNGFRHGPRLSEIRDLGFGPFSEALSDEDRSALRRAFIEQAPDIRSSRRQMRADIALVLTALRADPYDPDVLRSALAAGATRTADRQALGQKLIFEHVSAMEAKDRRSFADRLEAALTRRGQRDGKRRNGDEPPPRP